MGCINSASKYQPSEQQKQTYITYIQFVNRVLVVDESKTDHQQHLRPNEGGNYHKFHHDQSQTPTIKEQSDLLKQINFQKLIEYFAKAYGINLFLELKEGKKHDIKSLQIVIRALYTEIINQKLMSVNRSQINIKQCKVLIAQSMLSILIESVKFTVGNYSIDHGNVLFTRIQKYCKTLSNFLKTKYPRGKSMDAGKLSKEFKEFDCTEQFNHDIIANAKVIFKSKQKKFEGIVKVNKLRKQKIKKQNKNSSMLRTFFNGSINPKPEINFGNPQCPSQMSQKVHSVYSQGTRYIKELCNSQNYYVENNQNQKDYKDYYGIVLESQNLNQDKLQTDEEKQLEITNNIKILLNRIMDQIDRNYQNFSLLFKEINPHFLVNRKISENTPRCTKLDTGVVEITSIQIARVFVKWLENLQDILQKPEELLTSNYEMKVAKYDKFNQYLTVRQINLKQSARNKKSQIKYTKCSPKELQKLLTQGNIIQKLKKGHQKYKNLNSIQNKQKYEQKFKQFTTSILTNLQNSILDQSQISSSQMEIVKYSYEVSNLISWIVEQKLINIIKILTDISERYKLEKGVPNFIKFKVNDLMRCHLSGDRKTIKQAYDKILEKETQGQIDIIKIKNRFHTDNNDAMILFKMKGSFLVCQCQLALSEQYQKNDQRIKNIKDLNHFLYELQRSPFGILGQLSVFLKTESHTVSSYHNKLRIKPTIERIEGIKLCHQVKKQNNNKVKQNQNNNSVREQGSDNQSHSNFKMEPFMCSICFRYFQKYSNNQHLIFSCKTCATNLCRICQNNKISQKSKKSNDADKLKQQTQEVFQNILLHIQKRVDLSKQKNSIKQHGQTIMGRQRDDQQQTNIGNLNLDQILQLLPEEAINNSSEKANNKLKDKDQIRNQVEKEREKQAQDKELVQKEDKIETQQYKQSRIKAQKLMQYFEKTQSVAIKNRWKIHFVVFEKIGNQQSLILYRYNSFQSVIENVYSPIQKYLKHEYIELGESSKILVFKNIFRTHISKKEHLEEFIQQEKQKKQNLERIKQQDSVQENDQISSSNSKLQNENNTNRQQTVEEKHGEKTQDTTNNSLLSYWIQKIAGFSKDPQQDQDKISASSDKGFVRNINAQTAEKNAQENPGEREQKFKQILSKCIQPFDYQIQMKFSSLIKPSRHQFYFAQYKTNENDSTQSIFFLIDAQISKGNGEKYCVVNQLLKLPKIKSLKKQIDLSNLGADSEQLTTIKQIMSKTVNQIEAMSPNSVSAMQDKKGLKEQNLFNPFDLIVKINRDTNELNKSKLQKPFYWIVNIKILDLSKNTLNDISILSSICPKIQRLNVSENIVQKLQFEGQFQLLRQVKAQDNLIEQVKGFKSFRNVQFLDLSQNRIDKFTLDGQYSKLKQLDLSNNYIQNTQSFYKIKSLQILNMYNNNVNIAECIQYPKTLRVLNLESNIVNEVKYIEKLQKLENVNLEKNWINNFSINEPLYKLKCIKISRNPLQKLYLSNAINLEQLHLNEANLTDDQLEKDIVNKNKLLGLKKLSLKSNSLTKIPDFSGLMKSENLSQVYLEGNPILYGIHKQYLIQNQREKKRYFGNNQDSKDEDEEHNSRNLQNQNIQLQVFQQPFLQYEENEQRNSQSKESEQQIEKNQQDLRKVLANERLFKQNISNIKLLLDGGVYFSLPIQQSLLKHQDPQCIEIFMKLAKQFKGQPVRYTFFDCESNEDDQQRQKFFKKKPQTQKNNFTMQTHENSKTQKLIELNESANYIYVKHVCEDSYIKYNYTKDDERVGLQILWHPQQIDFGKFFMFDWSRLSYLNLAECSIDNQKWEHFITSARAGYMYDSLNSANNQISQVTGAQLQKLKSLQCIFFYASDCDDDDKQNPLSTQTRKQIKEFNQTNNPKRWVVSNEDEEDKYYEFFNSLNDTNDDD